MTFREELIHEVLNTILNDDHTYHTYITIYELLNKFDIYELVTFLPEEQRKKWEGSIV